jgi:hypothetical protein
MVLRETNAAYSEDHKFRRSIYTPSGQILELLNIITGGLYSYHCPSEITGDKNRILNRGLWKSTNKY